MGAGRRTSTISPSLRRALEARDRGCRFPGCDRRFTDAHHVKHWADGGETSLSNTCLLCKVHHRAVHEGGVRICIDVDGQVVFFTPRGKALFDAPRLGGRLGAGRAVARRPIAGDPAPGRPGDGRREDGGEPLRLPGLDDDLELGPSRPGPGRRWTRSRWTRAEGGPRRAGSRRRGPGGEGGFGQKSLGLRWILAEGGPGNAGSRLTGPPREREPRDPGDPNQLSPEPDRSKGQLVASARLLPSPAPFTPGPARSGVCLIPDSVSGVSAESHRPN